MAMETLMHNTEPLGALLGDASDIIFDNGGTDLTSDNVEDAIKELTSAENIAYDSNNSVKDMLNEQVKIVNNRTASITVASKSTITENVVNPSISGYTLVGSIPIISNYGNITTGIRITQSSTVVTLYNDTQYQLTVDVKLVDLYMKS